jgi:hypothetical protein
MSPVHAKELSAVPLDSHMGEAVIEELGGLSKRSPKRFEPSDLPQV